MLRFRFASSALSSSLAAAAGCNPLLLSSLRHASAAPASSSVEKSTGDAAAASTSTAATATAAADAAEEAARKRKAAAVADMHAKYATEGQASDAMGTLTVDEAARLGYVGWRYRAGLVRDLLPSFSLATALIGLGAAAFYVPDIMLTWEAAGAAAAGLVAMQRLLLRGTGRAQPVDMRGRVVVVTGASSNGIGRQVAAAMLAAGAEVIISHRTASSHDAVAGVVAAADKRWRHFVPKGQEKATTTAELERRVVAWPLTLEDRLSVVKFAAVVRQRFPGGVDLFVQCAGSTPDFGDLVMTKNGYEHHIDSNFIGAWQLTEALLPGMKRRQMMHGSGGGTPAATAQSATFSASAHGGGDASPSSSASPEKKSEKGAAAAAPASAAASAGNGAGRVVFVVHPGNTMLRGKNLISEFFAPSQIVEDWRFNNSFQQIIAHFGLVCGMHNLTQQRGLSCACAYPGRAATMYRRDFAPSSTTLWRPLLVALIQRTPYEAAQSVVFAATSPEVPRLTPTYVSDCKVRSHWKSRTGYDEKKMAAVVAWAQSQLKSAARAVSAASVAGANSGAAPASSSSPAASSTASPTGAQRK